MIQLDRVRFALPRNRDLERIKEHLAACGLELPEQTDQFEVHHFPAAIQGLDFELLILSPEDIGTYVERGIVQLGVVGTEVLFERDVDAWRPFTFNFGSYPIVLGARRGQSLRSLTDRPTLRLATPLPKYTSDWFSRRGFEIELIPVSDNVQQAVALGLADAFVNRLDDPRELTANGFCVLDHLGTTHLKLIVNNATSASRRAVIGELIQKLQETMPEPPGPIEIPFDVSDPD